MAKKIVTPVVEVKNPLTVAKIVELLEFSYNDNEKHLKFVTDDFISKVASDPLYAIQTRHEELVTKTLHSRYYTNFVASKFEALKISSKETALAIAREIRNRVDEEFISAANPGQSTCVIANEHNRLKVKVLARIARDTVRSLIAALERVED